MDATSLGVTQLDDKAETLLDGNNIAYLEPLYEQFIQDPSSVSAQWQEYFSRLVSEDALSDEVIHSQIRDHFRSYRQRSTRREKSTADMVALEHDEKQSYVLQLINAYRFLGHLKAKINPINSKPPKNIPELTLENYGLDELDQGKMFNTGSLYAPDEMKLSEILNHLQQSYCGTIGCQYMHISNITEKRWLQQQIEGPESSYDFSDTQQRYLLERLTAAETLERYLHNKYVGQKRFSLEGGESLIPLLDDLIQNIGDAGGKEVIIGMAHRGRLNVLVNILGKSPHMLFQEFEGTAEIEEGLTWDVKYHMGYSSDMNTPGGIVHVSLAFNPSHLEIVGPVVEGSVRARQDLWSENPGDKAIPIVIHGDAAFAGQGVVMETLNMSNTRGFKTRGTIRIIINNQIGFTTSTVNDARSTDYCSDISKMVDVPVFHVNGDDPEAVIRVSQIALDYRMKFHKDVVIDLVCYRRHGHNEADEPAVTQPMMYKRIRALATTREIYASKLINQHVITQAKGLDMIATSRDRLEAGEPVVPHLLVMPKAYNTNKLRWSRFLNSHWTDRANTTISKKAYQSLGTRLNRIPDGFELHPRVAKIHASRQAMADGKEPADWGFGEMLAYASLLEQGFPIRISGQDSERGTFFHRHAVLHDQQTGETYTPLKKLSGDQARFIIINSLLSELAVLAFEYGYSTTQPDTLVIWEAQFGDFANGAQIVIDQFISSGEQKWGRLAGLTMFLPHGFEGMGPEHSSARLERYLQMSAEDNMQICIPTTPAQVFHMLRRQLLRPYRKPLIVFTPKSLLRHPLAVSDQKEFTQGHFYPVIDDIDVLEPASVTRLIFCSGKVYYDLLIKRREQKLEQIVIIRTEQAYPFPEADLNKIIARYPAVTNYIWCQEEPLNQGSWFSLQHHYRRLLPEGAYLHYASRPASAAPAVGNLKVHQIQQTRLIAEALGLENYS